MIYLFILVICIGVVVVSPALAAVFIYGGRIAEAWPNVIIGCVLLAVGATGVALCVN